MGSALANQVAIVTGGGWNVGRAVAERFAAEGAAVVVASRTAARLAETVTAIETAGGRALAVPTDVTKEEQVAALVDTTVRHFGTVDVLAALAGGGLEHRPLEEVSLALWEHVFAVNVRSTFLCARAVLPILRAKNRGSILTCAGGGAFFPMLGPEYNAYACAKAAVCRFTDQLTAELWETGIRVNGLTPGKVLNADRLREIEAEEQRTGVVHPERQGNRPPHDAAELALWLVSEQSAPLRGRIVSVDDDWWRDPDAVARVDATVHAYRLRRADL